MSLKEKLNAAYGLINRRAHMSEGRFDGLKEDVEVTLGLDNRGEMPITVMVTSFIAIAIIIAIGVVILSSVEAAMPAVAENSSYYGLQTTIEASTVSGYGLVAIVLVIVAAAAIMYAVRSIIQ